MREFRQILVFIRKDVRKNGLGPQIYANFYEFWGEATETNGVYCKIYEKTVLAHEFWGDNQYFGSLSPRIALQ